MAELFLNIEFEIKTITPPLAENIDVFTICDPETNEPIGVNKNISQLYKYSFDLKIFEERYNVLTFRGGNASLLYNK